MERKKVVLVTGASSGLGKDVATLMARRGYRVFGTSRNPSGAESHWYTMLALDVRSDESVDDCVRDILRQSGTIDVLINNAGFELAGAIEETSLEEAQSQFETNFFGIVRMVKAVLPAMRRQRSGHIINIGSLAGLLGVPFHGFYSASKFALEGYTETLRHEVRPFNIHVSIIEPSFMKTKLGVSSQLVGRNIDDYASESRRAQKYFEKALADGDNTSHTARVILSAIETVSPRLRYRTGKDATWLPRVKAIVPEESFAKGLRKRFGLDRNE